MGGHDGALARVAHGDDPDDRGADLASVGTDGDDALDDTGGMGDDDLGNKDHTGGMNASDSSYDNVDGDVDDEIDHSTGLAQSG